MKTLLILLIGFTSLFITSCNDDDELSPYYHRICQYHYRSAELIPDGSIIMIGDSITQGFCVSSLGSPSVNYGIGSDTTLGVLERISEYKLEKAKIVILAIGTNDFKWRSEDEIIQNYQKIISKVPAGVPVLISSILAIDESVAHRLSGRNAKIKSVNDRLYKLAASDERVHFLDNTLLLTGSSSDLKKAYHVGDGVHLNNEGNRIWRDSLKKAIKSIERKN